MPKPGYMCITLKTEIVKLLKNRAKVEKMGLNELLLHLLRVEQSCHGGVRGFESRPPHHFAEKSQLSGSFNPMDGTVLGQSRGLSGGFELERLIKAYV